MQTEAWQQKSLNTQLASWANSHRPLVVERISSADYRGFEPYFPYGYIEPQPKLYGQLLDNVKMIKKGFSGLQIISATDPVFQRLSALETVLTKIQTISQAELENKPLTPNDFVFINDFNSEIRSVTGDIKPELINNKFRWPYRLAPNLGLDQSIDGLKYLVVIYTNPEGKLILAVGPILNYSQGHNGNFSKAEWQKALNL